MHETPSGTIILPRPAQVDRPITMGVQKHFTGSIVFGANEGQVMPFESHTEKLTALVMLARRSVVDLESQIRFPWVDQNGQARTHYFDFRVSHRDGSRVALIVKNSKKAREASFLAEVRCIASQVTSVFADRVSLITERHLDPVEVYNAELIHCVRIADPEADAAVKAVIAGINGATKIGDIVTAARISGRGFLAVARMIGKHEIELVSHERIGSETLVRRGNN